MASLAEGLGQEAQEDEAPLSDHEPKEAGKGPLRLAELERWRLEAWRGWGLEAVWGMALGLCLGTALWCLLVAVAAAVLARRLDWVEAELRSCEGSRGLLGELWRTLGGSKLPDRLVLEWADSVDLPHCFWDEFNLVQHEFRRIPAEDMGAWDLWALRKSLSAFSGSEEVSSKTRMPSFDITLVLNYACALRAHLPFAILANLHWRDVTDVGYSTLAPLLTTNLLGPAHSSPEPDLVKFPLSRAVTQAKRQSPARLLAQTLGPNSSPTLSDSLTSYANSHDASTQDPL
jgi:hypothetical protein